MHLPFEHDISADPALDAAPIEESAGPVDPPMSAVPDEQVGTPTVPGVDVAAAQRRVRMQLYSRMMTDLEVLTGGKRMATDAEIDEALVRAARAQGLIVPRRPDQRSAGAMPDEVRQPPVAAILPIGSGLDWGRSPFRPGAAMPDMRASLPDDADGMMKSFRMDDSAVVADQTAPPPASLGEAGSTPAVAPQGKPGKPKPAKKIKAVYPSSLSVNIPLAEFLQTGAARWGDLEAPEPSKRPKPTEEQKAATEAEKRQLETTFQAQQEAYRREKQNARREGRPLPPKPVKSRPAPSGKDPATFSDGDLEEVRRREQTKPKSVAYDAPDPRVAAFVLSIAAATANAKVHGTQDVEKTMVVGPDASGVLVVKWIALVGRAGGRMPPSGPGDTMIHVHYDNRKQPPHESDSSAARAGRVSYVIGRDGRNVWEVRREGDAVKVGLITAKGYGPFEDFQPEPDDYTYYNTRRYP